MDITSIIGGLFSVIMGLIFIFGHKAFGAGACRFQEKVFKLKLSERGMQISYFIAGIGFLIIGIYVLVQQWRMGITL